MMIRSRSQDLNVVEAMSIASWGYSRRKDQSENLDGKVSGTSALDSLCSNPHTPGPVLHFIATGEKLIDESKNELRPESQDRRLKDLIKNPNVEPRTLRVIANKAEPELAQLAKERLSQGRSEARAAFFQMVRNLFK